MPPEKLLTQREFDSWRSDDQKLKERILDHIETQSQLNLEMEGRMSKVEAGDEKNKRVSWTSLAIAVITGVATVLAALFGG